MPGYKQPCRHCGKLVDQESNLCPFCGKKNPIFLRCAQCKNPIQQGWKVCTNCGLNLEVKCPKCGQLTIFTDFCDYCGAGFTVICSGKRCKTEQPFIYEKCIKCNKKLK